MQPRAHNADAKDAGPRKALSRLVFEAKDDNEIMDWVQSARLDAITGSASRSLPSLRSGIRCYITFVGEVAP